MIFVPYTKFLTCNFIGEKKKSEYYSKPLSEIYFTFYNDYQRQNPFTKRLGLTNYLKALKDKGYLSKNAFDTAIANIDKLNLMEIYYGISRGKIPLMHQSVMANTNNRSISGNNIKIRESLVNPSINDNEIDRMRKQKYFDSQINLIFGNRLSLENIESIEEDPYKFPMDTIDEEAEKKDKLVNAYNNPLGINMGFGPLLMDNNIYRSVPMTISKRASYINEFNNQEQNYQNKNSNEISIKINNDIQNYRNKQSKLSKEINELPYNSDKNNNDLYSIKNGFDSENKQINVNLPFKASINQSQNSNETNINIKNSDNSINNNNDSISILNKKDKEQNYMGNIPSDPSLQNNDVNENKEQKEKSDDTEEVNNNSNNLFTLQPNDNNNNQNDFLNNSNGKNMIPMDSVSNNIITEKNNESNLIKNNNDNVSDISISNNIKNEKDIDDINGPKFPSFDKDRVDVELSKSESSDFKHDNNNELEEEENSQNEN